MAREKKITVKPLANTELASHPKTKKYKLYVRVTYNRSSTRFPLVGSPPYGEEYWVSTNEVDRKKFNGSDAVDLVRQIAERERDRLDIYGVRVLSNIYKVYNYEITSAIERVMLRQAGKILEDIFTVSEFKKWQNQTLNNFFESFDSIREHMPDVLKLLIDARQILVGINYKIKIYEWVLLPSKREKVIKILELKGESDSKKIKKLDRAVNTIIASINTNR